MTFRRNLLIKIEIDKMVEKILTTIGPLDSGLKLDKDTMRRLLEMSPYQFKKERDLDLYVRKTEDEKGHILVLDNDLPIFRTTPEDVGLRKSPTVKEMISIRNIIKILNDSDVIVSKKEASLKTIQKECIELLDFSYSRSDIEEIEKDGIASLENGYTDGIKEALLLFSELLQYRPVPKIFQIRHHDIFGSITTENNGQYVLGPVIIYSMIYNSLKLIEKKRVGLGGESIDFINAIASGKEKASLEGPEVFRYLSKAIATVSTYVPNPKCCFKN